MLTKKTTKRVYSCWMSSALKTMLAHQDSGCSAILKFQIFWLISETKSGDLFVRCSLFLSHYLAKIGEIKYKKRKINTPLFSIC